MLSTEAGLVDSGSGWWPCATIHHILQFGPPGELVRVQLDLPV